MSIRNCTVWLSVLALLAMSVGARAETATATPYDLVEDTTVRVMAVVNEAEAYVDDDPERYYDQVQGILDPLIDYRGFARQVMGPYASSKRYGSLDEAGRKELREQLDKFTEVMRSSLVRTYSKGLLAFGTARIELEEPESRELTSTRVSVRQLIHTDNDEPYVVMYQMGHNRKSGQWMLRNVIIESVNLGEIYRDQFLTSARQSNGNLDEVIEGWTAVTVEIED